MRRIKKRYIAGLGVVVIVLIFVIHHYVIKLRNEPVLNSKPKHFLTITGHISSAFLHKVTLSFDLAYGGLNTKCFHTTNVLAGMKEGPGKTIKYLAKPNEAGLYKLIIPLDRYKKGFCDWQPYSMMFNIEANSDKKNTLRSGLISFGYDEREDQKDNPSIYIISCDKPFTVNSCNVNALPRNKSELFSMLPDKSYHFKFNLLLRGQ